MLCYIINVKFTYIRFLLCLGTWTQTKLNVSYAFVHFRKYHDISGCWETPCHDCSILHSVCLILDIYWDMQKGEIQAFPEYIGHQRLVDDIWCKGYVPRLWYVMSSTTFMNYCTENQRRVNIPWTALLFECVHHILTGTHNTRPSSLYLSSHKDTHTVCTGNTEYKWWVAP